MIAIYTYKCTDTHITFIHHPTQSSDELRQHQTHTNTHLNTYTTLYLTRRYHCKEPPSNITSSYLTTRPPRSVSSRKLPSAHAPHISRTHTHTLIYFWHWLPRNYRWSNLLVCPVIAPCFVSESSRLNHSKKISQKRQKKNCRSFKFLTCKFYPFFEVIQCTRNNSNNTLKVTNPQNKGAIKHIIT